MFQLDSLGVSQHRYGVIPPLLSTPIEDVHSTAIKAHLPRMLGEQIRANIARLREKRGWSRPDLGKRCRPVTSGQQIERLEKGQRGLDTDWIERLSRAFGVDPIALIVNEAEQFSLTPEAADEVALHLARFVLRGDEPDPEIVQGLSILVQGLSETFAAHPQAYRDPASARLVIDLLGRGIGRQAS